MAWQRDNTHFSLSGCGGLRYIYKCTHLHSYFTHGLFNGGLPHSEAGHSAASPTFSPSTL